MNNKQSEYNNQNKQVINQRNKDYYANYYQHNKQKIITRVQNNYFSKIHGIKEYKPSIIPKTNQIIDRNILISLMD